MKFGSTNPNAVRPAGKPVKDVGTGSGRTPFPKDEPIREAPTRSPIRSLSSISRGARKIGKR
jgi:hypothetical protein